MSKNFVRAGILAVSLAIGGTFVAAPVAAQPQSGWEISRRIEDTAARIERNVERGRLGRRDARQLRMELDAIRDAEARMRADGRLDRREREILDRRLARVNGHLTEVRR